MEHQRIRQLLLQYLRGQVGEQEKNKIDEWYASFDQEEPASLPEEEAAAIHREIWATIEPVTREADEAHEADAGLHDGQDLPGGRQPGRQLSPGIIRQPSGIPQSGILPQPGIIPQPGGTPQPVGIRQPSIIPQPGGTPQPSIMPQPGRTTPPAGSPLRLVGGETGRRRRLPIRPLRAAAVILLLAGAAGAAYYLYQKQSCASCGLASTEIKTSVGEKKWVTLSDSSRVLLDAASTIRVYTDFSRERRIEVEDGEAFFDVKKDDHAPFIVQSSGVTTTVLGTSFTVAAYKELNNVSIGVVSGKVKVAGAAGTVPALTANEQAVYDKKAKIFRIAPLDEAMTAWQQGRLVLNDLSFDEMAAIVRKNFGITITAGQDAIKSTRYTTELLSSMSAADVVEILAAIHSLKTEHKENKVYFYH